MYFWAEKMVAQNKNQLKEAAKQAQQEASGGSKRHSLRQSSEAAEAAAVAREKAAADALNVPTSGGAILINILRALLARAVFIVHSLTAIWAAVNMHKDNSIWTFALVSVSIVIEGSYTIVMRAGDERKWFSPSILLYILATAPPIWLLETKMCEWRLLNTAELNSKLQYQVLEQLLLVVLIVGRWILPKGEISREQLSQILLAYLAISSDIVEFFDVFKERVVFQNLHLQYIVLSAWTLSLLQFPFILTVSRARKVRIAINEEVPIKRQRPELSQLFYDVDLWAIFVANSLQDIPFLLVRLYLIIHFKLVTYTLLFFLSKNVLVIVLQSWRAFVLLNDRYIQPKPPSTAEMLLEHRQQRRSSHPNINSPKHKERRATLAERRPTGISSHNKLPRRSVQSVESDEGAVEGASHSSARRASAAPRASKATAVQTTKLSSPIIEKRSPTPTRPRSSFDDYLDS
ncbi:hypothetical protein M3Y98_00473800 [Aphelenchoides besseyi]|nr:hypothetical protein M3Y98_00473800 [Aphelenchoides besseyi]